MRGIMILEGQEPFEIYPVQPPAPPAPPIQQSAGPLIMAFLLVFTMVLPLLGIVFMVPIANITETGLIKVKDVWQQHQDRKNQQALEDEVKILLTDLSTRLQELRKAVYALDAECTSRLGVSLTQLSRHSTPGIDNVMSTSNACAQTYAQFRNMCVTETALTDADTAIIRIQRKLSQGILADEDRDDLVALRKWIESRVSTLGRQKVLIGQLSEYLPQSL